MQMVQAATAAAEAAAAAAAAVFDSNFFVSPLHRKKTEAVY